MLTLLDCSQVHYFSMCNIEKRPGTRLIGCTCEVHDGFPLDASGIDKASEKIFTLKLYFFFHFLQEFYDLPHKLFRIDVYKGNSHKGAPGPISIIHDFSTSVQYVIDRHVINCKATSLEQLAPYFIDITTNDDGTLQLVSPNNFFFLGSEFNYSYKGVSKIRGVDVDLWVSVQDFERLTHTTNLAYKVFFTQPDWIYTTDHSINTNPVPWRIIITENVNFPNFTNSSITKYNTTFEMDFFDFSTEEPPYDAFDISSCSAPDDFYTMILIIPGQERGIDFGQLRRNIRMSVSNYTGSRPLQIGNIQVSS